MSERKDIVHGENRLSNEEARKRILDQRVRNEHEQASGRALSWARDRARQERLSPIFPTIQTQVKR